MTRVYISPDYSNVPKHADNGGIRRVFEAMDEHLPKFGVEVVHNPDKADVICNHGSMLTERKGIPNVHVGHGFYWSRQPWGDGYKEVNEQLVESMAHSVAHTAPSEWVARAIRRGGFWYPEVVYHGVDTKEFKPSKTNSGYVLWNKAREDYVSDPMDMMTLASLALDRQFHSTLGHSSQNIKVLGVIPYEQMKKETAEAGLYLSTARETMGIGTLEALACGVPVIGWDWGGNSEVVQQGQTGYLAPPGDYRVLVEMMEKAFSERSRLSANCIEDARQNWIWEPRIKQYAEIFKRVAEQWKAPRPKVSVIVTAYKLDQYLPKCLQSITAQTFSDFECLVVDDASLESTRTIVQHFAGQDARIRYLPTPNNFGLVGARNFGLSQSKGELIRHVDADDWLAPNALELETTAADTDRGTHIFYGHLAIANDDGSIRQDRSGWPPRSFNWYQQMAHMNQLPSCAMVRREVYEHSGGYRERMRRNEDAEFWCRVTSLGFRAKKFTEAVTYFHRDRPNSKGAEEWRESGQEPDWTAWFPWRMGATDFRSAADIFKARGENPPNPNIVPFGAQGKPSKMKFWHVHDFAYPVVSIIVTVGPTHEPYLLDALDSIQAQRFVDWECIVVNDTGKTWDKYIMGAPWAKVVNMDGNRGASAARNAGLQHAKGRFVIWMDADDIWFPWTLEKMVSYGEDNTSVIYSDFLMDRGQKVLETFKYLPEFDPRHLQKGCAIPGSSVLIPRLIALRLKWDEQIAGIEDWDYQYQLCNAGACFYHIQEPLFVYRMYSSTKRESDHQKADIIAEYMDEKWSMYRKGERKLMCGCTQKPRKPLGPPKSLMSSSGTFEQPREAVGEADSLQMVTVEYIGDNASTFTIASRIDRNIRYRFGANDLHKSKSVFFGDAQFLTSITDRNGKPTYRIVAVNSQTANADDPASFMQKEIA